MLQKEEKLYRTETQVYTKEGIGWNSIREEVHEVSQGPILTLKMQETRNPKLPIVVTITAQVRAPGHCSCWNCPVWVGTQKLPEAPSEARNKKKNSTFPFFRQSPVSLLQITRIVYSFGNSALVSPLPDLNCSIISILDTSCILTLFTKREGSKLHLSPYPHLRKINSASSSATVRPAYFSISKLNYKANNDQQNW